jgi:AhpD family alkylhydroperoxidase
MRKADKIKISEIQRLRKESHSFYLKKSEVYRAFTKMESQTYRDGALKKMNKELIAIGISVAINCESCMEWHISQAINDGAKRNEILEAVEVGIEMSGGPGTVSARFALQVINFYQEEKSGISKE